MKRTAPLVKELLVLTEAVIEDLRVQRDLGSPGYDLSPEALAVLDRWDSSKAPAKAAPRPADKDAPYQRVQPVTNVARPRQAARPIAAPAQDAASSGVKVLFVSDLPIPANSEAGALLNKIAQAMGFSGDEYKVADLNGGIEGEKESGSLDEVMNAIRPQAVCVLGEKATRDVLGAKAPFAALAGRFHQAEIGKVLPTWHPSTILACRFPEEEKQIKGEVWKHMQVIMKRLGLSASKTQKKKSEG
ncbi:MAG: hypothetical protein HZB23_12490 [Deltaproteobacteria bacterium]|nr:hypothetical protein [Deltaproteobacteria bacterium]